MPFTVGENIGPYRIVEQLGQGGMATVFKAYHASLDRYVAIKALHPAFNQDPNFEARFQREARVVAKLEYPNIVPVYDYAEHENRPYLVMKFIEGVTLKAYMDQGPLSSDEISKIVDAVGSSLAYAHKQGVLHRDIKPSNVLVATDGQIYLADFGLARIAQSGESTLSSDMIMGTPQYISPEQAMGKADLDQRTDLYSFGVMLYEMVVGKVPFNADTPFSIIHDHIYSPLPLPRAVNPNVPETVERVLLKALAKEREDRFEDAIRLMAAFKDAWQVAGVPMQGSDAVAPQVQAVPTDMKTVVRPESTKATDTPETVVREENVQRTETVSTSGQKRSPWMWVSVALVVVICLGVLAFARNNRLFARLLSRQPDASSPVPPGEPALPPPVGQPNEPGPDADTHLDLALQAWHENDLGRSMAELNQAITLRADQNDFLVSAGTQMFDAGNFIGATRAYARAVQNFRERDQEIPPEVRDRFEQSLYFAAATDEFILNVPVDGLRNIDPAVAFYAQSRYALLHGNKDVARDNLDELLRVEPDWPLAQLLNAEFMVHDGKLLEPRRILDELMQMPDVPDWVKEQAGILLGKTQ